MANTRKSTKQHIDEGTYREDRHGAKDCGPHLSKVPSPPDHLDAIAKKKWTELATVLVERKNLADEDLMSLEILCANYSIWYECYRCIKTEGIKKYVTERNPQTALALTNLNKITVIIKSLSASFGLSPTDRARLKLTSDDPEDDMKDFFE
jgi:P27 family predicted phage terminase small subunit